MLCISGSNIRHGIIHFQGNRQCSSNFFGDCTDKGLHKWKEILKNWVNRTCGSDTNFWNEG